MPENPCQPQCHEGWKTLYEPLFEVCKLAGVEVRQCKEKFGGLCFYVGKAPDWLHDLILAVEDCSFQVCEECGQRDGRYTKDLKKAIVTTGGNGWIRTLCEACRKEHNAD